MALSVGVFAQLNTNSPYSRYGIGELFEEGTQFNNSMGGSGIGITRPEQINVMNPAALGFGWKNKKLGHLMTFDMAFNQRNQWLKTNDQEEYNPLGQLQYVALRIPLTENWGTMFSIAPMSSVGYYFVTEDSSDATGLVENIYLGTGGVNKISFGTGFKINLDSSKRTSLALGGELNYLFGTIYNEQRVLFKDPGSVFHTWYNDETAINDVSFNFGAILQHEFCAAALNKDGKCDRSNQRKVSLGFTYSLNNQINGSISRLARTYSGNIGFEAVKDTALNIVDSTMQLGLPQSMGVGFVFERPNYWTLSIDGRLDNWGDVTPTFANLANSYRVSAGMEWVLGDPDAPDKFPKGSRFRTGVRYGKSNLSLNGTQLEDFGITFGFGLKLNRQISKVNLGMELGRRGTLDADLIRETYVNFSLGITLNNWWFKRRQYE